MKLLLLYIVCLVIEIAAATHLFNKLMAGVPDDQFGTELGWTCACFFFIGGILFTIFREIVEELS